MSYSRYFCLLAVLTLTTAPAQAETVSIVSELLGGTIRVGFAPTDEPTISEADLGSEATVSGTVTKTDVSIEDINSGNLITADDIKEVPVGVMADDTVTFTFDTSENTSGYDITKIYSVAGWNPGAGGRASQYYDVTIEYVDGTTAELASVSEPNAPNGDEHGAEFYTAVTITDTGGVLAGGVKSITFTFTGDAPPGGVNVFSEIDIEGSPAGAAEPG